MTNYVNREDIDTLFKEINNINRRLESMGVSDISELLADYYDQSEIDVVINKANNSIKLAEKELETLNGLIDHAEDLIGDLDNDKINKSDIVDNLTTNDSNKVLSAKQGKVLQDNKVDKVSGKGLSTNDYTNADKNIVDNVTSNLAGKVDKEEGKGLFSGSYGDLTNKPVFFGTSSTGATTKIKEVTAPSDYVLTTGTILIVKFTNAQTYNASASNPVQLKVNNGTVVNVAVYGTTYTSRYHWSAGEIVQFVYDGTNFVMTDGGIATTTYYGVTKLNDTVTSTSTYLSATANSVKQTYDYADTKQYKYYLVKENWLVSLFDETLKQLNNSQTLTGMHLALKNQFNLTSGLELEQSNNKYYLFDGENRTEITSYITNGIEFLIDDIITTNKREVNNKSNIGHTHSATDVDVMVGSLHQSAQFAFDKIWEWQSQHSGGGGSDSRVFYAQATWDNSNKLFTTTNADLPSDDWQVGDILILNCLAVNQAWYSKPLVDVFYEGDGNEYFRINTYTHSVYLYPSNNHNLWTVFDGEPIILICMVANPFGNNQGFDFLWDIVQPSASSNLSDRDFQIIDNLTTNDSYQPLSAKQGKVLNDKFDNYQTKISDSGWQDLDFTDISDFETYNTTTYNAEARKIGNQVYVRGAIKNTVQATSTSAGLLMAKLPNGFAPSQNMYFIEQGTNSYRYMLIVNTSGELRISRYTNSTTTQGTIGANSWLAIYCNFLTD